MANPMILAILCSIFMFTFVTALDEYTVADILDSPPTCSIDNDCTTDEFAICAYVNVTVSGGYALQPRCVCDGHNGYFKNTGTTCVYHAYLGESCSTDGRSTCSNTETVCKDDGDNAYNSRCLCKVGYTEVKDSNDNLICAKTIHKSIDLNCSECEAHQGTCYDLTGDFKMDGCVCPIFTSGIECDHVHVSVDCDITSFTMRICYEPQVGFNFSDSAVMIVDSHGVDEACKGYLAPSDGSVCPVDTYQILLPLDPADRERCGTKVLFPDIVSRRYQNNINIQKTLDSQSSDDLSFTTSCTFRTHADTSFNPVGLFVANKDGRGERKEATLTMYVENHLGRAIPEGVALRLGDKIRLRIVLTVDGTYSAIRVLRCTGSTKPSMPDPRAFTVPLILASCPAPNQIHMNDKNNWRPVTGSTSDLRTGLLRMFKMPQGHSVHIHCAVKLCLTGSENECDPVSCTSPAIHQGYGRRKRSDAYAQDMQISKKLLWYNDETSLKRSESVAEKHVSTAYPISAAVLGVLLAGVISLAVGLLVRLRSRRQLLKEPHN